MVLNKPPIHEADSVTFVEGPNFLSWSTCEGKWYHKLNAQIDIQNMNIPRVRYLMLFQAIVGRVALPEVAFI